MDRKETGVSFFSFHHPCIDSIIDRRMDLYDCQPTPAPPHLLLIYSSFYFIPRPWPLRDFNKISEMPVLFHAHPPRRVPAKRTREGLGVSSLRRFLLNFYTFVAIFLHFCIVASVSSSPLLKMVDFPTQGNFISTCIDPSREIFYRSPALDGFLRSRT